MICLLACFLKSLLGRLNGLKHEAPWPNLTPFSPRTVPQVTYPLEDRDSWHFFLILLKYSFLGFLRKKKIKVFILQGHASAARAGADSRGRVQRVGAQRQA